MVLLILKFQLKEFIRRINIFSNRLKNFRNDVGCHESEFEIRFDNVI